MLRKTGKGTRRARPVVGLLVLLVALIGGLLFYGTAYVARQRQARTQYQEASEATHQRAEQRRQQAESARASLAPPAQGAPDWSFDRVEKDCRPLIGTDFELLGKVFGMLVSRGAEARGRSVAEIRAHAETAVAAPRTTAFEREVARHLDAPEDIARISFEYVEAFAPLREAEQALDKGLYIVPSASESEPGTPWSLARLAALRALGELRRGDRKSALKSVLHGNAFARSMSDMQFEMSVLCTWAPCRALEPTLDALWRGTPPTTNEREALITALAARPDQADLVRQLRAFAAHDLEPASRIQITDFYSAWTRVREQFRDRALTETVERLEPLLGRPSFEVETQFDAICGRLPRYARFTIMVCSEAAGLNRACGRLWEREGLLRMVMALKDYGKTHGNYPKALVNATETTFPAMPRDADCGQDLVYASDGTTFSFCRPSKAMQHPGYIVWHGEL